MVGGHQRRVDPQPPGETPGAGRPRWGLTRPASDRGRIGRGDYVPESALSPAVTTVVRAAGATVRTTGPAGPGRAYPPLSDRPLRRSGQSTGGTLPARIKARLR